MVLRTPDYWYRKPGEKGPLVEYVSGALAFVYQAVHRANLARQKPYKAAMPVICVGGAVAGGSGKTPVCVSLMKLVQAKKLAKAPAFLTRGYGGSARLLYITDPQGLNAAVCGDEALLLAKTAPVIVAKDRAAGAKLAAEKGIDLLVMDDGLQNNTLEKDLALLVVDGASGFGNGKTLPAGPLREPVADVVARVDACVIIGDDERNIQEKYLFNTSVLQAFSESVYKAKQRVVAFAGIGRPEKFFEALKAAWVDVVEAQGFADHHVYSESEINMLREKAEKLDAVLVTTQKDMVRLKSAGLDAGIDMAGQRLSFKDEGAVLALLKGALA